MRKILTLAVIAAVSGAGGPVLAGEINHGGKRDPRAVSISAEAMKAKIGALGYEVRALKTDDGCFKALLVEPRSGGAVQAIFSTATGELVRARLAS